MLRRDATYVHPEPNDLIETLTNAAPANAGDLAALLLDRIDKLAETLRYGNGNTDDWRQYWNEGSHRRVGDPRHEESCRDAFLSDLRGLLPPGVDGQPEGQHSGRNRSDIRVSFRDFFIPVEIKKNNHRELWSAARRQLIDKYTRNPKPPAMASTWSSGLAQNLPKRRLREFGQPTPKSFNGSWRRTSRTPRKGRFP